MSSGGLSRPLRAVRALPTTRAPSPFSLTRFGPHTGGVLGRSASDCRASVAGEVGRVEAPMTSYAGPSTIGASGGDVR